APPVPRHPPPPPPPRPRRAAPARRHPPVRRPPHPLPTPPGAPTPRAQLLDAWREDLARDVPDDRRARVEALLWSAGGVYDDDTLTLRRRLYDTLESTLDAFARDVDLLNATLARLLRHDAAGGA
ncbi:MAG: hypothetical protein ACK54K_15030, partial [Gemmatimonadaceae bacterium]